MEGSRYQAYPEYKDSGIEWVGRFPANWTTTRVKFESYVKARVGWHGLKSEDFTDEGPYLVTGSDFKGPRIEWSQCYHCDLKRYEQDPYIQLQNGDLLITKDGTIGKVAIVDNLDDKATLNSGVFVVRPLTGSYTSIFYFWLLQSSVFFGFVDFNKTGSTISHLYQDTFVNFMFAMPSVSGQQQIANFLDHKTAKIDTLIAKQEKLIELLQEKRQAVISHAVTKGLDPDVPMKASGVEWLGEVPAHWDTVPLKFTVNTRKGVAFKSQDFCDQGVRVVKASDIKGLGIKESDVFLPQEFKILYPKAVLSTGDLILSTVGSNPDVKNSAVGQLGQVPQELDGTLLNQNTVIFDVSEKLIIMSCLFRILQVRGYRDHLDLHAHGTANQSSLNIADMLAFSIPIPPLNEQKQISNYIDAQVTKLNILEEKTFAQIDLLKERRTALISAAVTGKIDVRNWEPKKTQDA